MPRSRQKRLGILTGGGDCPGLNAAIRAVVYAAESEGFSVQGLARGWDGVLRRAVRRLRLADVAGIIRQGGTILHTSRTNPFQDKKTERKLYAALKTLNLDALVALGGEDTLGVAARLAKKGYPIIGVPKTIDNDLRGTDLTIGFDTAVSVATDAIDRLHTTAESHNRVIVIEVMGRHAGWIATHAGLAGGADAILIPERPFRVAEVAQVLRHRHGRKRNFSLVVVAEGAIMRSSSDQREREGEAPQARLVEGATQAPIKDSFGHVRLGGIGETLARLLEKETGYEVRSVVLGYLQRGGDPTAFDRVLATRLGLRAAELAVKGRYGRMAAYRGGRIADVALSEVTKGIKTVDRKLLRAASIFFG